MTEPSLAVVAEVEAFLARHDATARSVKPSGVQEIVDDTTDRRDRGGAGGTTHAPERHRPDGVTLN